MPGSADGDGDGDGRRQVFLLYSTSDDEISTAGGVGRARLSRPDLGGGGAPACRPSGRGGGAGGGRQHQSSRVYDRNSKIGKQPSRITDIRRRIWPTTQSRVTSSQLQVYGGECGGDGMHACRGACALQQSEMRVSTRSTDVDGETWARVRLKRLRYTRRLDPECRSP